MGEIQGKGGMVERVARAIYGSSSLAEATYTWEGLKEFDKENCRILARAALEAMKSGTDHEIEDLASAVLFRVGTSTVGIGEARDLFRSMIEQALKE